MIFSSKPEQIQSEVILAYRNTKNTAVADHLKAVSPLAPKKKQRVLVYNHDLLCCEYQYAMLSAPSLIQGLVGKKDLRILVLGTGAGLLPMFLHSQLGANLSKIITVDMNPEVIKVIFLLCML